MELKSFVSRLQADYPDLHFAYGKRFSFRPPRTVQIGPYEGEKTPLLALHELGHALSGLYDYTNTVDRLKIERQAWSEARKVYDKYAAAGLPLPAWDEDFVEEQLDTYRDWLHARSKCKNCGLTRYQDDSGVWHCPYCEEFTLKPGA